MGVHRTRGRPGALASAPSRIHEPGNEDLSRIRLYADLIPVCVRFFDIPADIFLPRLTDVIIVVEVELLIDDRERLWLRRRLMSLRGTERAITAKLWGIALRILRKRVTMSSRRKLEGRAFKRRGIFVRTFYRFAVGEVSNGVVSVDRDTVGGEYLACKSPRDRQKCKCCCGSQRRFRPYTPGCVC